MNTLSFAWRGPPGSGKRTQLLQFLEKRATKHGIPFKVKESVWYMTKPSNGSADPEDADEEEGTSKTIPYEESAIHMGFDVARMSMSDKLFLQSILTRWTGQEDVVLSSHQTMTMRYLVLYHAQYLTDESTLQLQEALEQYPSFAILVTTELPICPRLRDLFLEIPVPYRGLKESSGDDKLLTNYVAKAHLPSTDVWMTYFDQTLDTWSSSWPQTRVQEVRNWIYTCLQRNLRWTDVIQYWIKAVYRAPWMTPELRKTVLKVLWKAESGAGWVLVTSYRIPILWESVHSQLARTLYECRSQSKKYLSPYDGSTSFDVSS
jgi:hypothetical protein